MKKKIKLVLIILNNRYYLSFQTSTPLSTRNLPDKTSQPPISSSPVIHRSDIHPVEQLTMKSSSTKRKRSANSISPNSNASLKINKRPRNEILEKRDHSKIKSNKRKQDQSGENRVDDVKKVKPTSVKRKLNLELSSKLIKYFHRNLCVLENTNCPRYQNEKREKRCNLFFKFVYSSIDNISETF